MRPKLKEELEYALWTITGTPLPFNEYTISSISREISRKTGEDPAVVSLSLIEQIKQIVNEDVDRQMSRSRPRQKASVENLNQLSPGERR